jgi:hypothetical protein
MSRIEYHPDVELNFVAIPTDRKINIVTVHQLLDVDPHTIETIKEALHHYN